MRETLVIAALVFLLVVGCKPTATPMVEPDQPVEQQPGGAPDESDTSPDGEEVVSPSTDTPSDDEAIGGLPGAPDADATEPGMEVPPGGVECGEANVTDVQVLLMESWPVQVGLVIRGTLPDACTEIADVQEQRSGNTITLTVQTNRPKDMMCAQVVTDFEHRYRLEGGFYSGDYTIDVNGFIVEFHVD